MILVAAKVGYEYRSYVFSEGEASSICVNYTGSLERPLEVGYSLVEGLGFGKYVAEQPPC